MDGIAVSQHEQARFLRPAGLPGVEALHATFVEHRYPPHVHEEWVIACVASGVVRFGLEGRSHLAPERSVFLIPPHAVHTGQSAAQAGYTYRVLYLEPEPMAERYHSDLGGRRRYPFVLRHPGLTQALAQMHRTLRLPRASLEQGEALAVVLSNLQALTHPGGGPLERAHGGHRAVASARAYIHDRWQDDFTLDQLAAVAGLSPYHLARRFRDELGMPPSTYRRALRIQAAKRLLRTGVPPALTAAQCGFYDQPHLNRHFKRIIGVTPSQYASAGQ